MALKKIEIRRMATLSCRSSFSSSSRLPSSSAKMSLILQGTMPSISGLLFRRRNFIRVWRSTPNKVELRGTTLIICNDKIHMATRSKETENKVRMYNLVGSCAPMVLNDRQSEDMFPFKIQLLDRGKTLYFAASNNELRLRWIEELNAARIEYGPIGLRLLSTIGAGHFGKVVLAQKRSCCGEEGLIALKEIKLKPSFALKGNLTERFILTTIPKHPFLIQLQCCFRHGNYLYYGFDFKPGADLFEHTRRMNIEMDFNTAQFYMSQIVLALRHLHKHRILYRDLKPENILVDKRGDLCLADLGLSKYLSTSSLTHTICGTRSYLAPEMISSNNQGYSYSVDFWQLGCFAYELFSGRSPFWVPCKKKTQRKSDYDAVSNRIIRAVYSRPSNIDDLSWDLIVNLLNPDPGARLGCSTAPSLHHIFDDDISMPGWDSLASHQFFCSINWSMVLDKIVQPPYKPNCERLESNFGSKYLQVSPHWGDDDDIINGVYKKLKLLHEDTLQGFGWVRPVCENQFGSNQNIHISETDYAAQFTDSSSSL